MVNTLILSGCRDREKVLKSDQKNSPDLDKKGGNRKSCSLKSCLYRKIVIFKSEGPILK